jgi:hypothetical protein
VVAEAVSSRTFQEAVDALDEGTRLEIEFAVYAIEEEPAWRPPHRYLAPPDSPYSGSIIDFSVEGYGIVYRVVDRGAAVELWYLFALPPAPAVERPSKPPRSPRDPVPMM